MKPSEEFNQALVEENALLRMAMYLHKEALLFYADEQNYQKNAAIIRKDKGTRAAEAFVKSMYLLGPHD